MSAGTIDVPRVDVHAAQLDGRPIQSVPVPFFARAPVQPDDDVLRSDVQAGEYLSTCNIALYCKTDIYPSLSLTIVVIGVNSGEGSEER